ncbi:hypothetical protein, partial [Bacillus thuringiensis]
MKRDYYSEQPHHSGQPIHDPMNDSLRQSENVPNSAMGHGQCENSSYDFIRCDEYENQTNHTHY